MFKLKVNTETVSIIVTLLLFGGVVVGWFFVPFVHSFFVQAWDVLTSENQERIHQWVGQYESWGVVVLLILFLIQMIAFIVPSWLLIIVSILAYGPVAGSIIALIGILLAASVAYAIGRFVGNVTVQKIQDDKTKKIVHYLNRFGVWFVIIFRLSPFLSDDLVSYAAGLIAMNYLWFMSASALGIFPLIILIAFLGDTNEHLIIGLTIASIVSAIGFIVYIMWDKRQNKKYT